MSKLFLISIIALAVAGVISGVFEVRVHPEKFGNAFAGAKQFIGSKDIIANSQYYAITWMRKAEIAVAGDEDETFTIYMKHVEKDAEALKQAIDMNKSPGVVVAKSRLLDESLQRAKSAVETISDDAMARVRDQWVKVLSSANQQLGRLAGVAGEYQQYKEALEGIAPAQQEEASDPTPTPVPLKF